jgi:hypothetical protein
LADRIETGEDVEEANIAVELLYEEDQKYLYATKIADNLDINMPKPSHY